MSAASLLSTTPVATVPKRRASRTAYLLLLLPLLWLFVFFVIPLVSLVST